MTNITEVFLKLSIFLKSWLLAVVVVWTIVGFGKANASPEVNSRIGSSQTKSSPADFDPKFGLGVTGLVVSGTLYPMRDVFWTYYHGGIQLDFL